jgi:Arc/MetJ-type ribon-helix-helix transcriptional regulator
MSSTIHAEIPEQLWQQAQTLIEQGWATNLQELVNDALRRYLESHQDVLNEAFIQDDVEWGLHGKD